MKLTGLFRSQQNQQQTSAHIAKERLKIIVAHQRSNRLNISYIPELKQKLLDVILNYVKVDDDKIEVIVDNKEEYSSLEINIQLPS